MKQVSPFKNWKIDYEFVRSVVEDRSIKLVSLDVFDTALTRSVDSPVDAFAEIEKRLALEIGSKAVNFAADREVAEQRAREKYWKMQAREEIDLNAIYAELISDAPYNDYLIRAREIELEVERDLIIAVPDILELTRLLKKANRPFIFVSDMYLPSDFIAELLMKCGYEDWKRLYVSSEIGATKATGRIWDCIANEYSQLEEILHIGDDESSDGKKPRAHGIKTMLFERVRTERRLGAKLTPDILPFSFLQREVVINGRAIPREIPDDKEKWRELGYVLGGIVLAGFLIWLKKKVKQHGIERLYFCARDGWLIQQAWNVAGLGKAMDVEDRYFYISRRPLNLARGYLKSNADYLSPALLEFLTQTDDNTPLRIVLNRANLIGTPIETDVIKHYRSLDAPLPWAKRADFEALLKRHAKTVYASLRQEYEATVGYVEQEQLGSNVRCAIVDLGWYATAQRSLMTVLNQHGKTKSIQGFYYGLWPAATGNRFEGGMMESAFASEFIRCEEQPEMWCSFEILEEFHSAPHGTVVSYKYENHKWMPIIAERNVWEVDQYNQMTSHFQQGTLETVATLFKTGRCGPIRLEEISPTVVKAALGAICLSPSHEELSLLGKIRHCSSSDHFNANYINPNEIPRDEAAMYYRYDRSPWRPGMVLTWIKNAATSEQKALIKAFAKNRLCFLGERALRRFVN